MYIWFHLYTSNYDRIDICNIVENTYIISKFFLFLISENVTQWNPYANSNAYFDSYWMEKQEAAFTNWLNFILTPNDDLGTDDVKGIKCKFF